MRHCPSTLDYVGIGAKRVVVISAAFLTAGCAMQVPVMAPLRREPEVAIATKTAEPGHDSAPRQKSTVRMEHGIHIGTAVETGRTGMYIIVSKKYPETLYLIDQGRVVFKSRVNTGLSISPTPDGTFRISSKYPEMTMKGKSPVTGHMYVDRGIFYAMRFHDGDFIHYFPREGYGWKQSFGCVEMPFAASETLYGKVPSGTTIVVQEGRPARLHRSLAYIRGKTGHPEELSAMRSLAR